MAALKTITYKVISLSLLVIILSLEARAKYQRKVVVEIINNVTAPIFVRSITIHCKSNDDDLGFHTLMPTKSYNFTFVPNIFFKTLFFCSFTWQGEELHYLDVYNGSREQKCGLVSWTIDATGGCKFCAPPSSTVCYQWNKPPSKI